MSRVWLSADPYQASYTSKHWANRGVWPAKWVTVAGGVAEQVVSAYRCRFSVASTRTMRVHVTADERYELYLDGALIGRGSERGDIENWFFESYDLSLSAGEHVLVARVWSLGSRGPYAQFSVRHGLLLSAEGDDLSLVATGVAAWQAKALGGVTFIDPSPTWGTGANVQIDASKFDWGFERGAGEGWQNVVAVVDGRAAGVSNEVPPFHHKLKPATLPKMMDQPVVGAKIRYVGEASKLDMSQLPVQMKDHLSAEASQWEGLGAGGSVRIAANTRRRVIVDLDQYYCVYPFVTTSGGRGSTIRVWWAESLFHTPEVEGNKGHRDEIDGKYFVGAGDVFMPDGGASRTFSTLWWQAGRYIEIVVETGDEVLTIDRVELRETRYPLEMTSTFASSEKRLNAIVPVMVRGMAMCSHETYMDCPYYEQLMYVGDTRLEVLTTFAMMADDRLPRKALRMFDASRINSGLTQSRYPSRVRQIIPPFSMWWVAMVHDYAMWRNDRAFVSSMMPGVRAVLDAYLRFVNAVGLIEGPLGWNFMDWAWEWDGGIPAEGEFGVNTTMNWQTVVVLKQAAELEEGLGEKELATRYRRRATELAKAITSAMWDEKRGLFAEKAERTQYSEHAQSLAILSGECDAEKVRRMVEGLAKDKDLVRTTIYFTHYLFEAARVTNRVDLMFDRLPIWDELTAKGFRTTAERPEPSRSDCHAWGAHPLFHYFATILGIRPKAMGFQTVTIEPQLGTLEQASGKMVHPKGMIEVDVRQSAGKLSGTIVLPAGVTGELKIGGKIQKLSSGRSTVGG